MGKTKRLKYLGLTCLDTRRVRSDLIETFKIMNGLYDVSSGMSVEEGVMKLFKRRFRLDVRKFVFSNRTCTEESHKINSRIV